MTRLRFCAAAMVLISMAAFSQEEMKLSLNEALRTAVERNLDVHLQRITVESQAISLELTKAQYEPRVLNTTDFTTFAQEATDRNQGDEGATSFSQDSGNFNNTLQKNYAFGLGWEFRFNNNVRESTRAIDFSGKTFSSSFSFGIQQQLLKGFSFDPEIYRNDEFVARGNFQISQYDLEIQIVNILQLTEDAYWDLVMAIEQLNVNRQSLELAKQLYEQNKVKIEVGTLAPIELVNTEAEIASRERDVITGENSVRAAEDALKRVMNLPSEDWYKTIKPTDPVNIEEIETSLEENFETAFENRPELRKNVREKENALLTYKLRKNELKPELQFGGSYFANGASVPVFDEDGLVLNSSLQEAITKAQYLEFPGWNVSLNLTWTPLNKQAKLNLAQARIDLRQNDVATEQTKVTIREEVRSAYRDLEAFMNSIRASEKARKYREENLKAEVQKFQNGLSTNYLVAQAQNDLTEAESQVIQAKIDYLKALVRHYKALGKLPQERRITVQ